MNGNAETWASSGSMRGRWIWLAAVAGLVLSGTACTATPEPAADIGASMPAAVDGELGGGPGYDPAGGEGSLSGGPTALPAAATAVEIVAAASATPAPSATPELHPLQIAWLRDRDFPGSDLVIEQTLSGGANYDRYVASYLSDGLKIYALLTIPRGEKPPTGWPVVVFNHGYIPPAQYRTTERYVAYTDAFARNGYIVLKSDYRGHGNSEGEPAGGYGSPGYTVDVLNALASVRRHPDADPARVGMWGHSMGGYITLRSMVVSPDIKAGVIWAGVVASYPDLLSRWRRTPAAPDAAPTPTPLVTPTPRWSRRWRDELVERFGQPEENPEFWSTLSANTYLPDLSGPIQLHHGTADTSVPVEFSETLFAELQAIGWPSELHVYPGNDHNISGSLSLALQRSVDFFDAHVKGAP